MADRLLTTHLLGESSAVVDDVRVRWHYAHNTVTWRCAEHGPMTAATCVHAVRAAALIAAAVLAVDVTTTTKEHN